MTTRYFFPFDALSPPQIVESTVGMESQIVSARVAALQRLLPEWTVNPSESVYKNMESSAYRETLLRQYFNERALSLLLPYATGADLDGDWSGLVALSGPVVRQTCVSATDRNGASGGVCYHPGRHQGYRSNGRPTGA